MTYRTGFLKATLVGGVVFLVPFIVTLAVLGQAFKIMRKVAEPVSRLIPIDSVGDVARVNILAVVFILLVCFLAGLVARSPLSGRLARALESKFLDHIPVYAFIKGMTTSMAGEEGKDLRPVVARLDDYSQVAFEVERLPDGNVVVYLPGAPNPWSGSVCIMAADRVRPVQASMLAAASNIRHLGKDSENLLRGPSGASRSSPPQAG